MSPNAARKPRTAHGRAAVAHARDVERLTVEQQAAIETSAKVAATADMNVARRAAAWVRADPVRRGPVPVILGVPVLGEAAHLGGVSTTGGLLVTTAAAFAGYAGAGKWTRAEGARAKIAGIIGAGGVLATAFAELGLGGPGVMPGALLLGYGVLSGVGYLMYRSDAAVRTKLSHQTDRREWHGFAHKVGLGGSHLQLREDTRLGERFVIDTTGTGKRASGLARGDLAERFAELYKIRTEWVRTASPRAGLIEVNVFTRSPWSAVWPHPVLDDAPELVLPPYGENDITRPQPVGVVPEWGTPMQVELWNDNGAQRIMIVAKPGGGKTTLINAIIERITASFNAVALAADVSVKGTKDLRRWQAGGAVPVAACGVEQAARALMVLELGVKAIEYRAKHNDEGTLVPRRGRPLLVLILDELDALTNHPNHKIADRAKECLKIIGSKSRSEAVALVLAGQRPTAKWFGGADVRAMLDTVILGRVNRARDAVMACGGVDPDPPLPNVAKVTAGAKGAMIIVDPDDGSWQLGRGFNLSDLGDVERLASARKPAEIEPGLLEYWGDLYTNLLEGTTPSGTVADTGVDWKDLEESVPEDLREEWRRRTRAAVADSLTEAPGVADPNDEAWLSSRAERERQDIEAAQAIGLDPQVRAKAMEILRTSGRLTNKQLRGEAGFSAATAGRVFVILRAEGVIVKRGRGRASHWVLAAPDADEREAVADDGE